MPSAIIRLCFWFLVLGGAIVQQWWLSYFEVILIDDLADTCFTLLNAVSATLHFKYQGLDCQDFLLLILIMLLTNMSVIKSTDLIDHVDQRILSPSRLSLSSALFSQVTHLIKNNIIVNIIIIITIFTGDPVDPSRWSSVCVHLRHSRSSQPDAPSTAYLINSNYNDYINGKKSEPLYPKSKNWTDNELQYDPEKKSSRNLTKKMRFIDFLSGTVCESSDDEDGCDKYGPSGIALS